MLPKIKAPADFFVSEDGSEFHYVGASEFGDWKRFLMPNGPEALVRPNLIERQQVRAAAGYKGPVVNRVFRYADPGNSFGILPYEISPYNDYSKVNAFMDLCAEYDCYVDWTCGDSQKPYMIPSTSQQQADLDYFCSQIARPCFIETCNEPFKNGELPQHGVVPAPSEWYLRDSGYYAFIGSEIWHTEYNLDFVSIHTPRVNDPSRWPKWVCDIDDTLSTLRTALGKPPVFKEGSKFGTDYTDSSYAKCLGLRANIGGVVFHSQKGLESNGYDDATKAAATEYYRGVQGSIG